MDEQKMKKKMMWGIVFGLLFIAAAAVVWFFSGEAADTLSLSLLFGTGVLMILLTVVKILADHRYFLVMVVLGVVMIAVGVIGTLTGAISAEGGSLITGGLIMVLCGGLWLSRSEDERIVDERSQKIGTYGTAFSWYVTFMAIILFYWLDMLDLLKMQASGILGGLMFLMIGSALFFQWYYNRRGDVY